MELNYRFISLCNWVNENGGFVNKNLSISSGGDGKFIKSKGVIYKDEKLFNLPVNLILNKDNVGLDIDSGSDKIDTAISLLFEVKKEESFWHPYLNILPEIQDFKNHPIYLYRNNNISNKSNFVNYEISVIYNEYLQLREYLNQIGIFDLIFDDEIFWAFLVTTTRMWGNIGLIPIADLFQHSYNSNIKLINEDSFSMCSDKDFTIGEQIYDNYSVDNDFSLFFNFGFIQQTQHTYSMFEIDYNNCDIVEKNFIKNNFDLNDKVVKKRYDFDKDHITVIINNINNLTIKESEFNENIILKKWIESIPLYEINNDPKDIFDYNVNKLLVKVNKSYLNCIKSLNII